MRAADLIIALLITNILLQLPFNARAQNPTTVNLKTRIKLGTKPIRFDSLVSTITRQAKVQFSFNTGKITPERLFTLKPGEQSLEDVLIQVKTRTGIYYTTIGSHIILLDKRPETNIKANSNTSTWGQGSKKTAIKKPVSKITERKAVVPPTGGSKTNRSVGTTNIGEEKDDFSEATKMADEYLYDIAAKKNAFKDTGKIRLTDTARLSIANNPPSLNTSEKHNRNGKQKKASEDKDFWIFAGGGLTRTTGIKDAINSNLLGWEANIKAEKRINQNFSGTVSFGVAHFMGRYKSEFNRFRSTGDTTIKNFTLSPLLAGIRSRIRPIMYLSAEAGITFKNKANDRIRPIISPSAGILLPVRGNNEIDLGLKFSHVVVSPSLLGDPILQTGGYSFLSLRFAYGF